MQVFVLLDKAANVYCVTADADAADQWLTFDGDFGVVECELNDFINYNIVLEEFEDLDEKEAANPVLEE